MDEDAGLFRATFHDSPIGIAILDEVGHYREVNRAFADILGLEPKDVVSRNFAEFTHPDDLPRDIELLSRLERKEFPFYQSQKRYLTSTGEVAWVRITVTRIDDAVRTPAHHIIAQIEDVTEVRNARELLEQQAMYDALTGLANRALLMERLEAALASYAKRDATVALIFFDIDDFKMVNDSLGHDAGDQLLATVAERIQGAVRRGDTVARLGGDEFVVLLEDVHDVHDAQALATVIIRAAQAPTSVSGHEVVPSLSAGLAIADFYSTPEGLLRDSDTAMYSAKKSSTVGLKVYDAKLRETAITKLEVEEDLRKALREGELRVAYQPVVDLATRETVGYEALVRWSHPRRGELLPEEFIAVAEQANLVVPIGSLVVHESCGFLARHPGFTGMMFINASPKQMGTANLARTLNAAVKGQGIAPGRVYIEIGDFGMLRASKTADGDLDAITRMGFPLILDDFGAGNGSFSAVLEKPIAGIKLAAKFTQRIGDGGDGDLMSRSLATLAMDLGLIGAIKGVESDKQVRLALSHGWTLGQGYLFGHAVPEAELPLP